MSDWESSANPYLASADEDWGRARRKVLYQQVVCAITQCSVDMMSFGAVREHLRLGLPHYRGLQEIRLDQIRGSVGRYNDFTSAFLPRKDHMRERWKRVDEIVVAGKAPPIEVYKVGQAYFVIDGNHRVSAARQHNMETIEANVTEFSTPFEIGPDDDIDKLFIEAERADFLSRVGEANAGKAGDIVFSCAGCYRDLTGQIDAYRLGLEAKEGRPVSASEAFPAWHDEVYSTAIKAIRKEGLLNLFPERTEADLFIWSWQNSEALEEVAEGRQDVSDERG